MVERKEKYCFAKCLYLGWDSLGVAANWSGCCQNVEPPSSALLKVIWSNHKLLIDLTCWNTFFIFVNNDNDKYYFNKQ